MHKNKSLLAALLFLPFVAQAASSASFESAGCTGSLSSALGEEAFLLCSGGDLSLIGGSITSDAAVVLHADGSLFLDRLSITAPMIELLSFSGSVTLGSRTFLNLSVGTSRVIAQPVGLSSRRTLPTGSGGIVLVSPGGDISIYSGGGIAGAGVGGIGGNISLRGTGGIVTLASPVPEPGVISMMLVGLLALLGVGAGRKRRGSGLIS